jgi:hypothetical protein
LLKERDFKADKERRVKRTGFGQYVE